MKFGDEVCHCRLDEGVDDKDVFVCIDSGSSPE